MDSGEHVHCSELTKWTGCDKSMSWKRQNPQPGPPREEHVATWMGTAVHAAVGGLGVPPPPEALVFDGTTPNLRHAHKQIERMALAVSTKLAASGWQILDTELEFPPLSFTSMLPETSLMDLRLVGRIDLLVRFLGKVGIIDIKTAKNIWPAWIQLGGYGLLYEEGNGKGSLGYLATVHCPRVELGREQPDAKIVYCDAGEAIEEARRICDRIQMVLEDGLAVASPGHECQWCEHPTCVVRTTEATPHRRRDDEY